MNMRRGSVAAVNYYNRNIFFAGMSELTPILLTAFAALFFFLPGMAAIFAFSGKGSAYRRDSLHFITASLGLSTSITIMAVLAAIIASGASHTPFQFYAVPAALALLTCAFLAYAALSGRLSRESARDPPVGGGGSP